MGHHHQATGGPDLLSVARKDTVPRRIPPVDPYPRRQSDGQPVAVPGRHLLAGDDQQPVGIAGTPHSVGGAGVVVGGDDEIQAGVAGSCEQVFGMVPTVGVNGVQMEVAAIPRGTPSGDNRRCGRDRVRNRLWRTAFQNHARLPTLAQRVEHHRAEGQLPNARGRCGLPGSPASRGLPTG